MNFNYCSKDVLILYRARECPNCKENNLLWFCHICEKWYKKNNHYSQHQILENHKKIQLLQKNDILKLFFIYNQVFYKIEIQFEISRGFIFKSCFSFRKKFKF